MTSSDYFRLVYRQSACSVCLSISARDCLLPLPTRSFFCGQTNSKSSLYILRLGRSLVRRLGSLLANVVINLIGGKREKKKNFSSLPNE